MKRLIYLITLIILFSEGYSQISSKYSYNRNFQNVDNKVGLNDSTYYTGYYIEYYPGEIKEEGRFKNGLRDGVHYFYNSTGNVDSITEYKDGLRNGSHTVFESNSSGDYEINVVIVKEYYTNNSLIKGYYWHKSGQLLRILEKGKVENFSIDSTIYRIRPIVFGMKTEYNSYGDERAYITKEQLCQNLNNKILLQVAEIHEHIDPEAEYLEIIYDTVITKTYTINNFEFGGSIWGNEDFEGHIDFSTGNISNEGIDEHITSRICRNRPSKIWIGNIKYVDQVGIILSFPDFNIYVKDED